MSLRSRMENDRYASAMEGVRAVYSDLANRPVERNCSLRTECCQFKLTGRTPFVTRGEALLVAKAYRASGRSKLPDSSTGSCLFLEERSGKCLVYDSRPLACRTHFCDAAGGPFPRKTVADLIHRLEDIDNRLGGDGGRHIQVGMQWALEQMANKNR